jgi:hypothetical protein
VDGTVVSVRKGCFSALAVSIFRLTCQRTGVRLRAIPRFSCQNEKSPLPESETGSFPSGVSWWKLSRLQLRSTSAGIYGNLGENNLENHNQPRMTRIKTNVFKPAFNFAFSPMLMLSANRVLNIRVNS